VNSRETSFAGLGLTRRAALGGALVAGIALPAWAQRPQAPFVPTPDEVVEGMLDLAELKKGEHLIDLGSGDGRIVRAAARRGATALGIEIDADLVARARMRARLEELQGASFRREDLFTTMVRDADVVTLYLLTDMNLRLRAKLLNEMRAGARLVSHGFDMGDWEPDAHRVVAEANVYLWIIPAVAGGSWRLRFSDGRSALLEITQRYQRVVGTLDGAVLEDASLVGDRLRFSAGATRFDGVVGDRTILPRVGGDWRADRL